METCFILSSCTSTLGIQTLIILIFYTCCSIQRGWSGCPSSEYITSAAICWPRACNCSGGRCCNCCNCSGGRCCNCCNCSGGRCCNCCNCSGGRCCNCCNCSGGRCCNCCNCSGGRCCNCCNSGGNCCNCSGGRRCSCCNCSGGNMLKLLGWYRHPSIGVYILLRNRRLHTLHTYTCVR